MKEYPKLVTLDGLITGCVSIGISTLFSLIINFVEYETAIGVCFAASGLLFILASLLNSGFKVLYSPETQDTGVDNEVHQNEKRATFGEVVKSRVLYMLALPNLLRGIAGGVVGILSLVGFEQAGLTKSSSSYLVIAVTTASIVGSIIYMCASKHMTAYTVYILASVMTALFLCALCFAKTTLSFCLIYFMTSTAVVSINYALPVIIVHIVPYRIMGAYTAIRLMLTMGGSALGSWAVGALIGKIPTFYILVSAAVMQLVSGIIYYIFTRRELISHTSVSTSKS